MKSLHNLYSIYKVTTLQDITTYQEAKAEFAEVLPLIICHKHSYENN